MCPLWLPLFCSGAYEISPEKSIAHLLVSWPTTASAGMPGPISVLPVVCYNKTQEDLQVR